MKRFAFNVAIMSMDYSLYVRDGYLSSLVNIRQAKPGGGGHFLAAGCDARRSVVLVEHVEPIPDLAVVHRPVSGGLGIVIFLKLVSEIRA